MIKPLRNALLILCCGACGLRADDDLSSTLGDWSSPQILSQLQVHGGTATAQADGVVFTLTGPQAARVELPPMGTLSQWQAAAAFGIEVQNSGPDAVKLTVQIDQLTGFRNLGAGETLRLALPLGNAAARVPGMKVPPPFEGWGKFQGVRGATAIKQIPALVLTLNAPKSASLRVLRTGLLAPIQMTGIVDQFGQYTRREWPGKVRTEADLRNEDPAISESAPTDSLDQYGGWKDGPKLKATGWFRAEKVDGRWWLVTPEGHAFFSFGVNNVNASAPTPVQGRTALFQKLPPETKDTADFYQANLARKFGADWAAQWRQTTLDRLQRANFNTLGAWSDETLLAPRRIAYTVILHVSGEFHRFKLGDKTLPDPFDPQFKAALGNWMTQHGGAYREDPRLLGYFVGNELPLGAWTGPARYSVVLAVLNEKSSPAKTALLARLQELHPGPAISPPKKWTPESEPDLRALSTLFAERYYQTVRDALREADPHHLYLGSRFAGTTPEFAAAAAKFCDVTSFNLYRGSLTARDPMLKFFATFDRPALVGEFHFGASDRGLFATGMAWAPNQDGRGEAYRDYVNSVAALPFFVGCHWFQYLDQPVSGRPGDGENFAIGLVSITDKPYTELLNMAARVNRTIYQQRTQPASSPSKNGN